MTGPAEDWSRMANGTASASITSQSNASMLPPSSDAVYFRHMLDAGAVDVLHADATAQTTPSASPYDRHTSDA